MKRKFKIEGWQLIFLIPIAAIILMLVGAYALTH